VRGAERAKALAEAEAQALRERILANLAIPMNQRTKFLRVRVPGMPGTAL